MPWVKQNLNSEPHNCTFPDPPDLIRYGMGSIYACDICGKEAELVMTLSPHPGAPYDVPYWKVMERLSD